MQDIVTVIIGIIVEATPFLVLGTILAVMVQKYALFDKILHHLPRNTILRRLAVSLIGVALPVCECGNIPLARGLMRKGLSTADALKNNGDKIKDSTLYFMRIDEDGNFTDAGEPFCTVCGRLALDSGIKYFALWNSSGVKVYDTKEYN